MVDTTYYAAIVPGQAKAPTTPTDMNITPTDTNTFHCTYGHTHEVLLKKTAELQGVNLSGNPTSAGGVQWRRGYGSPSSSQRTPEHVPSAPPAPPKQLPPNAKEGESTAG